MEIHARCSSEVLQELARREKSAVMDSSHRGLKFAEAAANMRRSSGSRGGCGRQDVPVAEVAGGPLVSGNDLEVCVTYKNAKTPWVGQKRKDGFSEDGGDKMIGVTVSITRRPNARRGIP